MDTVHNHPGGAGAAIGAGHRPAPTSGTSQPPTRRREPAHHPLPALHQPRREPTRLLLPPPTRPAPAVPPYPNPLCTQRNRPSLSATELDDASWHPPQPRATTPYPTACPAHQPPTATGCPNPQTHTAKALRSAENVASDATPPIWE